MKAAILYLVVSTLTLPFAFTWWLGELPLLALVQLPKVFPASWLRREMVLNLMGPLGVSSGSYSPDSTAARPYALAIVYCVPLLLIFGHALLRRTRARRNRWLLAALGVLAIVDYVLSLTYLNHGGTSLY